MRIHKYEKFEKNWTKIRLEKVFHFSKQFNLADGILSTGIDSMSALSKVSANSSGLLNITSGVDQIGGLAKVAVNSTQQIAESLKGLIESKRWPRLVACTFTEFLSHRIKQNFRAFRFSRHHDVTKLTMFVITMTRHDFRICEFEYRNMSCYNE